LRYNLGTDPASGERRVATTTVKGTRQAAEKELRRLASHGRYGEHVDPSRLTVREWLTTWLATVRGEVSPKSHEKRNCSEQDQMLGTNKRAPKMLETLKSRQSKKKEP
jgi:hypothetical protein